MITELQVRLPFVQMVRRVPNLKAHLKNILMRKTSLEDGAMTILRECNKWMQVKIPRKLADPGSFNLSCTIGDLKFHYCLCDLGASISVMPLTLSRCLGLLTLKPSTFSLV